MLSSITGAFTKFFGKQPPDYTVYKPVDSDALIQYNASRTNGPKPTLCYAPFKSLYFGHRGKVFACCYNRQYTLGTFPQKSILDIWFGEEADKLRNYIKHNDLSQGCGGCDNLFSAKNFDAIKAKMYDHYSENKNRYPSLMEFELSNTCNLECIMCNGEFSSSIRKNREKKPPIEEVYGANFVQQLEEFIPWLDEVKFYGGEPFLVDIYYEIWERIAILNPTCKISVQTNATVLNSRLKELLNKKSFNLNISLDSLEKSNYETIRVNAKLETVMENIQFFRQYAKEKDTFFGISCCAMRDNWRELPAFIDFCNSMNVSVYFHTVWTPVERSLWNLDSKTLLEICEHLQQFDFPQENANQKKNRTHYFDTLKLFRNWQEAAAKHEAEMDKYKTGVVGNGGKQKLYNSIKDYVYSNTNISTEEKEKKLASCFSKMTMFISVLPENYSIEKIYEYVNAQPINKLVAELELNKQEAIIKQALSSVFNVNE